ncbi:MAG: HNH endonuclease [Dehalococcoidia bacterium]|nr:HNH endonuclease [Dehalococcoidia bacterium]
MKLPVLVLNQNYEPLNVCNVRRAFVLLDKGKAETLEHNHGFLRSPSVTLPLPSVIRLVYQIHRPRPQLRLSRKEIFARDNYTCQYCGVKAKELTLDHVLPKNRGGPHVWENIVAACKSCNHKKRNRTPEEAQMRLPHWPYRPKAKLYFIFHQHLMVQVEWRKFLPEWEQAAGV